MTDDQRSADDALLARAQAQVERLEADFVERRKKRPNEAEPRPLQSQIKARIYFMELDYNLLKEVEANIQETRSHFSLKSFPKWLAFFMFWAVVWTVVGVAWWEGWKLRPDFQFTTVLSVLRFSVPLALLALFAAWLLSRRAIAMDQFKVAHYVGQLVEVRADLDAMVAEAEALTLDGQEEEE